MGPARALGRVGSGPRMCLFQSMHKVTRDEFCTSIEKGRLMHNMQMPEQRSQLCGCPKPLLFWEDWGTLWCFWSTKWRPLPRPSAIGHSVSQVYVMPQPVPGFPLTRSNRSVRAAMCYVAPLIACSATHSKYVLGQRSQRLPVKAQPTHGDMARIPASMCSQMASAICLGI